jgi:hypothetical protein
VIVAVLAAIAIAAGLAFTRGGHQAAHQVASGAPAVSAPAMAPQSESQQDVALYRSKSSGSLRRPTTQTHSVMATEYEGVRVAIGLVSVDNVPIDDHGAPDETEKKYLIIRLTLANKRPRVLNFTGWGHGEGVTLVDNLGNHYGRVHAPSGTTIVGQCETASLIGGRSASDVLVFKPPSDNADYLTLELPAANFGAQGTLTLRILRLAWQKNNDGG